jgi:hypothetical protein
MAFWSTNFGADSTLTDPKRKFRFKVEFTGFDAGSSFLWWAKSATKPSFDIAATEHKYLNHTFYYPGTVTWNTVDITVVDPAEPDMAASFAALLEGGGYHPPANEGDLSTMTKATAVSSLGQVTVTQIDAEGKALEKWTLWNSFISAVKYGELSYGDDSLTEITVTLKYDWAKLEVTTAGSVAISKKGNTFFAGASSS